MAGLVDSGNTEGKQICWNCGCRKHIQTPTVEYCYSCKILCDYWKDGINDLYKQGMAAKHRREEEEELIRHMPD